MVSFPWSLDAFPAPITASREPSHVSNWLNALSPKRLILLFLGSYTRLIIMGQKRNRMILACFLESLQ